MRVATDVSGRFTDLVFYDHDDGSGTLGAIRLRCRPMFASGD